MMAAPPRDAAQIPTIRCSNCGFQIPLDSMADHVCSNTSHNEKHSPEVIPFRGPAVPSNRDAAGRGPRKPIQLLKIDPSAANRPGQSPYSGELTPASSGQGSQVVSPRSDSSSSFKLPWPMAPPTSRKMSSPHIRGPPSPELMSQDCAFPPFPKMSKSRSNTPNSDSDTDTLRKPSYPKSNLGGSRESTMTVNSTTSKARSRRGSTASTKGTSKNRNRAKTLDTKQDPIPTPTTTSITPPATTQSNMRRKPSLSNLFGLRKTPTEKMPPMPTSIPSVPGSRKGSKDEQSPVVPVSIYPISPPVAPVGSPQLRDELEQLQNFDFQVPATAKEIPGSGTTENAPTHPNRVSAASSVYEDDLPKNPSVTVVPATPMTENSPPPTLNLERLSRLDGPGNASGKEPSYKAKRPAPIDSNLTIGIHSPTTSSPKRSPTFPFHNNDRKTGNGPSGLMGRRPSDSSSALSPSAKTPGFPLSPLRTGMFPPNSIGNLGSPRPVRTPTSAVPSTPVSFKAPLNDQLPPSNSLTNMHRASIDSASSYSSDASAGPSRSSQSSPPRDEIRREISSLAHDTQVSNPISSNLAPLTRPRLPRQQTDSPTDPLFQDGLLSSIPPSPSTITDPSPGLASNAFDFQLIASVTDTPPAVNQPTGFDFRPRQMSNSGEERPKQIQSRHVPRRSQTMGANKGICRGCDKIIASNQKSVSSADGRLSGKYHKECFVCHKCRSPFPTADFYVLRDYPYCADHYHELNGTLCAGCGKGIEGQYLESNTNANKDSGGSRKFHPHCLACTTCKCPLRDDYFEFNGRVYCERDAFRAASPPSPRSQYDTAPSRPSPLSQGMLRADSETGAARRFPERRTTKLMSMDGNGAINVI